LGWCAAQLSPGIFELKGAQTVYFQCVGSLAALVMCVGSRKGWELDAHPEYLKDMMYHEVMDKCMLGTILDSAIKQNGGWVLMVMLVIARLGKAFSVNKEVRPH
jgi:hypothetical protein